MKIIISCIFIFSVNIFSQSNQASYPINCDSLTDYFLSGGEFPPIENLPILIKSFAEVQNNFLKCIDTAGFDKNIYISTIIDSLGDVRCPEIIKGNNTSVDSIALNYVLKLKFRPAQRRKKKIALMISILFYCNEVKETPVLIRKNGIWIEK